MSDLTDKLREIQEQLEKLCKENNIEFYGTNYFDDDETPGEIRLGVWYPSRSDC